MSSVADPTPYGAPGLESNAELRAELETTEHALRLTEERLRIAEAALRDADRRTDELLATLSHELRNPLTPLKVAIDVLKLVPDDPVQIANSCEIMERQVTQLAQIVDDLRDRARVTQGKLELHLAPVDPALAIEAAVAALRPVLHHHEVTVHMTREPVRVLGDQARLTQVLTRLLANAAKATPDGGAITVTVERDRDVVRVRVRDDGAGIAPELLPHLFELFVQGRDARGRAPGGLGVGLDLARRLVELHGGTVSATSDGEGRGSELVVELPRMTT